jgi:hypothetical protein
MSSDSFLQRYVAQRNGWASDAPDSSDGTAKICGAATIPMAQYWQCTRTDKIEQLTRGFRKKSRADFTL